MEDPKSPRARLRVLPGAGPDPAAGSARGADLGEGGGLDANLGDGSTLAAELSEAAALDADLGDGSAAAALPTTLTPTGSPYITFTRRDWARLRADTPMTLTEADLARLQGINVNLSLREVEEIYLPLSRLLNFYVSAMQRLYRDTQDFLGHPEARVPYIIGLAGSVAVGKSTTARILQALLSRWPNHPKVEMVTTDGYLYPNRILEERGLMRRKGFPESFDLRRLIRLLSDVKAGRSGLEVPVYSHHVYDIVRDQAVRLDEPDIVIVEGLNVLQAGQGDSAGRHSTFVSDFFDFTLYVHAETPVIRQWYVSRFMTFRERAKEDPTSYFHRFRDLNDEEARDHALWIWRDINEVNLVENILPTRQRARLILEKAPDHTVRSVALRKI